MVGGLKTLLEASGLASAFSQEIQPGTTDLGVPINDDFLDPGGAHQEGAFHADAVAGDTPHGEGGVICTATDVEQGAFKDLDPFPVTLFDLEVDADRVAGGQFRDVLIDGGFN